MNILWLYKFDPKAHVDRWFHMDFVRDLKKHTKSNIYAYGPGLEIEYRDLVPALYSKDTTLHSLIEAYDIDVVILNTKSRMFEVYLPTLAWSNQKGEIREGCWLPPDFNDVKIPKVMIEEDYHYEPLDDWYQEVGIDLMLNRHYKNNKECQRRGNLKAKWLPLSVDETIFCPNDDIQRHSKVSLVGSCFSNVYPHRSAAYPMLIDNSLLDFYEHKVVGSAYVLNLQSYVSHLCGSSVYDITPAKMFEIMASGSILFTNKSEDYGLQQLFPDNAYCTYKEDYSDVINVAAKICSDLDLQSMISGEGINCIRERHTNRIRANELIEILQEEFLL